MKGMKEAQILVIVKEPGQPPRVEPLFENTLQAFQEAVGGYIETLTMFHLQLFGLKWAVKKIA